jgi:DNA adenine methylase
VAGDLYAPLIELYRRVQADPEAVIRHYDVQWRTLQRRLPDHYYRVRERFNRDKDPLDLCFLLRTCVNGIVRFNDAGEFNNSFHLSRRGMQPARFDQAVRAWHERLASVELVCQDYEATLADARAGDFTYLDPPYAGNKQRYIADLDCERFFTVLESLNRRGVRWAWSFDGERGSTDLRTSLPKDLYRRRLVLASGHSAVGKVLNGPVENVKESLYLNY